MTKLKPVDLATLIIWAVAATVWVVRLVSGAMTGRQGTPGVDITLAAVWTASLCVMLYRYMRGREGKE